VIKQRAWTRLRIVTNGSEVGGTTIEAIAPDGSVVPLSYVEAVDLQFPASWRKRSGLHYVSVPTPSEPPQVKAATPAADSATRRVAEEFQVGDVVTLKSGGRRWTVTRRPSDEQLNNLGLAGRPEWIGGEWLVCSIDDGRLAWAYMTRETLVKVSESTSSIAAIRICARCHAWDVAGNLTSLCIDCLRNREAK
jgi:hypothetical protein